MCLVDRLLLWVESSPCYQTGPTTRRRRPRNRGQVDGWKTMQMAKRAILVLRNVSFISTQRRSVHVPCRVRWEWWSTESRSRERPYRSRLRGGIRDEKEGRHRKSKLFLTVTRILARLLTLIGLPVRVRTSSSTILTICCRRST